MATARTGLGLDSASAEAHAVIGLSKKNYEWDWSGAEREFKKAIELNPGYATAHQWYCINLTSVGRLEEAKREIAIARELDPLSLVISSNIGGTFFMLRQYGDAVAAFKRTLAIDSNFVDARILLGMTYGRLNRVDDAIAELTAVRRTIGDSPRGLPELGEVYVRAGRKQEARETLDTLLAFAKRGQRISWGIASVYSALGEKEKAFEWLDRSLKERETRVGFLKVEPRWDDIRSDPRYLGLLKRMGLEN
jgi:tetratricopeptide (TPR) repeat protein